MASAKLGGSFRDPSGFVFSLGGKLYRQVNRVHSEHYDLLMQSGLYEALIDAGLLVPHVEVDITAPEPLTAHVVIQPERIPFVSYPYEWCFSQLKHAALATLKIQKMALRFGMSLRDCSAYNIQFRQAKPVLIDTLSFEMYREGKPWVAYRQFCQHFLAPLALMSCTDIRLNQLFRVYIDGIPLDLASTLLPFGTRLKFPLLSHIHLHARSQKHFSDKAVNLTGRKMTRRALLGLIDNVESGIAGLEWRARGTEWADYYSDMNYSQDALQHKKLLVAEFLDQAAAKNVWDLGANVGVFSRISSDKGIPTMSFDVDPAAVEKNYRECLARGDTNVLPLLLDLTNPSPGIGWRNRERISLAERGPAHTVLALALIHHLAISNNLPLHEIADFFGEICHWLVVEFVPKNDSQVRRLLATREDIFPAYTQPDFEHEFGARFAIRDSVRIQDSERTLYLMERE